MRIEYPDAKYLIIDSTIVRAHQHVAGAKKGSGDEAIGRSRGGLGTKTYISASAWMLLAIPSASSIVSK
jgi:hypothetical protein